MTSSISEPTGFPRTPPCSVFVDLLKLKNLCYVEANLSFLVRQLKTPSVGASRMTRTSARAWLGSSISKLVDGRDDMFIVRGFLDVFIVRGFPVFS